MSAIKFGSLSFLDQAKDCSKTDFKFLTLLHANGGTLEMGNARISEFLDCHERTVARVLVRLEGRFIDIEHATDEFGWDMPKTVRMRTWFSEVDAARAKAAREKRIAKYEEARQCVVVTRKQKMIAHAAAMLIACGVGFSGSGIEDSAQIDKSLLNSLLEKKVIVMDLDEEAEVVRNERFRTNRSSEDAIADFRRRQRERELERKRYV